MQPTIGRTVHYRLPKAFGEEDAWRAATVTRGFGACANLTVHLDGVNDVNLDSRGVLAKVGQLEGRGSLYVSSAEEGSGPGCWRWPPRAEEKPAKPRGKSKPKDDPKPAADEEPKAEEAKAADKPEAKGKGKGK